MCTLARISVDHPLMDVRFWLMDFSVFFCMLGTLILYIIYKDFAEYMGVGEHYSVALSGIGIGDVIGRVGTGFLASTKYVDAIFAYGLAQLFCCFVMVGHLFISDMAGLVGLTAAFGTLYGSQNVLIAVAPSACFGREKLVIVFGHILFLGGVGALIGAPIAGAIVDYTGMYEGVIWFTIGNLFIGSVLMFLCYIVDRTMKQQRDKKVDEL
ncbi:hypothetical protein SK128_006422 [Halocaridina rubra]|uniref:Major facilitator superfamily (MFS) profile domain-containing protein n=1 Tax=Halocaridina rubra TaxID=373956 RepID=A0AAN8WNJ8_HALRR